MSTQVERLREQGYKVVGSHTAVKTCHWTNKCVRDEGACYKNAFYGIESHRCIQMTPVATDCTQTCRFCWRDQDWDSTPDEWDSPEEIAESVLEKHRDLMIGYKGSPDVVPRERFDEAMEPLHVALSLTGEPTLYPELPELIEEFRDRGLSTFLVSNGTRPEMVERVEPTQLYLSLDATDPETYREICRPKEEASWEKVKRSLDALSRKDSRTALRVTYVKGLSPEPEEFAPLVRRADPDYVEVKAYMHIGKSRDRLDRDRMPGHDEVVKYSEELAESLPHEPAADVPPSRVALLKRPEAELRYLDG